jgi:hypothetical protein
MTNRLSNLVPDSSLFFVIYLKLAGGGTAKWVGHGGLDAAKRYVDAHPGEVVLAWRHPRFEIREGMIAKALPYRPR